MNYDWCEFFGISHHPWDDDGSDLEGYESARLFWLKNERLGRACDSLSWQPSSFDRGFHRPEREKCEK